MGYSCLNLGNTLVNMGIPVKAISAYTTAISIFKSLKNDNLIGHGGKIAKRVWPRFMPGQEARTNIIPCLALTWHGATLP